MKGMNRTDERAVPPPRLCQPMPSATSWMPKLVSLISPVPSGSSVAKLTGFASSSDQLAAATNAYRSSRISARVEPAARMVRAPHCRPLNKLTKRGTGELGLYARLLNACGIIGPGVEVGVLHGSFSGVMLRNWNGLTHYTLVDLWAQQSSAVYGGDSANADNDVQDRNYRTAVRQVVHPWRPCVSVLRMSSLDAARHFADGSLAFIYLDANHYFDHVLADLKAYWPKLMAGGMLAGHDVGPSFSFGVLRAVTNFAQSHRLHFFITDPPLGGHKEPVCCSGWYIFKQRTRPSDDRRSRKVLRNATVEEEAMCHAWWLKADVPCSALYT